MTERTDNSEDIQRASDFVVKLLEAAEEIARKRWSHWNQPDQRTVMDIAFLINDQFVVEE